jgi:hypothetical protein
VPTADVAWIPVLPSAKAFLPNLRAATEPAARTAGESAGRTFGSSFGSSSTGSVEAASAKMSAALRKTADAAGAVRVAEERLEAARSSGRATQVQIVTAEEGLAKARRNETAANEGLSIATRNVSRAQEQHNTAVSASGVAIDETNRRAGFLNRTFSSMQGVVAAGFGAFYAAQGAISIIGGTIKAASDLNETVNKSSTIFGSNMGAIDTWAKSAARNLGLSRAAALETAAGFGNMFSQLGFTADESARLSMEVTQMSADLGSFNNLPTADVADRIAGAFRGEYDSLQQLIPNISDARVKSEALAMTGKTNADSLTAQEKAAAVLAIVHRDGAAAMGDFARTSDGLANSQKILSAEFDNARGRLGALLIGPATAMVQWVTDMIPRLEAFGFWLGQNSGWLLPLAGGLAAVVVALKSMAIAQAAVNIVMEANPVVRVIGVLLLLGAALVTAYQSSETFRAIVDGAFHAVGDAAMWLWSTAIQPSFTFIQAHWGAVTAAMAWAWDNVLHPAWNAVAAVAGWLWSTVLGPTFTFIGDHWRVVLDAIVFAWDNVLHPAWNVLAAVATFLWNNILSPIFSAISIGWSIMVAVMTDVWNNILHPMWDLVAAIANLLYQAFLRPIFDLIAIAWTIMINGMMAAWNFILRPMWDLLGVVLTALWNGILAPTFSFIGAGWEALMKGMKFLYDTVLHPAFMLFGDTLRGLTGIFAAAAEGIRVVWNAIMDIASTPINFIIEVVFNKGLFTAWNWIVDKIGLNAAWHAPTWSQLPRGVHFAEGGPVQGFDIGGPVRGFSPHKRADNIPAYLTAGEFVEPVDAARFYGLDALEAVRRREAMILYGQAMEGVPRMAYGGVMQHVAAAGDEIVRVFGPMPGGIGGVGQRSGPSDHPLGLALDFMTMSNVALGTAVEQYIYDHAAQMSMKYNIFRQRIRYPGGGWSGMEDRGSPTANHMDHVHTSFMAIPGQVGSGPGGGAPAPDPWYVTLWGDITGAFNWFKDSIKAVGDMAAKFGNNDFVQMISALPGKAMNGMWDKIKDTIGGLFSSFIAGITTPGNPGSTGDVKNAFSAVMQNRGWQIGTPYWTGVDYVISHESGWNPTAQNPTSTASGLPQMINATWAAYRPIGSSAARAADATVAQQAQAFGSYVAARYRDPLGAMAYWQAHHNYAGGGLVNMFDTGGIWRDGTGGLNFSGGDERVLTAPQDDYWRRFVDVSEAMVANSGIRDLHVYLGDREITDLVDARLEYRSAADGLNMRSSAR